MKAGVFLCLSPSAFIPLWYLSPLLNGTVHEKAQKKSIHVV